MFFRQRLLACMVFASLMGAAPSAHADDAASRAEIEAALTQWTADFNAGRADKVCDLFSRELRVDFRGVPERDYDAQCDLLKKALADSTRRFPTRSRSRRYWCGATPRWCG